MNDPHIEVRIETNEIGDAGFEAIRQTISNALGGLLLSYTAHYSRTVATSPTQEGRDRRAEMNELVDRLTKLGLYEAAIQVLRGLSQAYGVEE